MKQIHIPTVIIYYYFPYSMLQQNCNISGAIAHPTLASVFFLYKR